MLGCKIRGADLENRKPLQEVKVKKRSRELGMGTCPGYCVIARRS